MSDSTMRRLLDWFDRERAQAVPVREPVTRARAAMAHEFMRTHSGIDFDAFHQAAMDEALLREPLGATAGCLTALELSCAIRSHAHEPADFPDQPFVARVMDHVARCQACWSILEEYQECEIEGFVCGRADSTALADAMWIAPVCIQSHGKSVPHVKISVVTQAGPRGLVASAGDMRLRFIRPFRSNEIAMIPVAETIGWSVMEHMPDHRSHDLVLRSYETRAILDLGEPVAGSLAYVAVSRQVEGHAVHATRIVRFGEPSDQPSL